MYVILLLVRKVCIIDIRFCDVKSVLRGQYTDKGSQASWNLPDQNHGDHMGRLCNVQYLNVFTFLGGLFQIIALRLHMN